MRRFLLVFVLLCLTASYLIFLADEVRPGRDGRTGVREKRTASTLNPWQISSSFDTIGDIYEEGKDLPLDHLTAIEWYRKAAQSGEPAANVMRSSQRSSIAR